MHLLFCFLALTHVAFGQVGNDVSLRACHRSDPEIDSCLLTQANKIFKHMQYGVEKYGMESLDPLHMDFITVSGDLDQFKIKMAMKNMTFYGHSDIKVRRIKFDPISLRGEISFLIPKLALTCEYLATGKLFTIPLESNAYFDGYFNNMEMTSRFRLKTVRRKGIEYFSVDKMVMKMDIPSGHMKLISVDPKLQPQVSVIENLYNENDELINKVVTPVAYEQATSFYKYVTESYLRKIPAQDLLPL